MYPGHIDTRQVLYQSLQTEQKTVPEQNRLCRDNQKVQAQTLTIFANIHSHLFFTTTSYI